MHSLFLSSGLCLIEVLSGEIVFADILEDKTVYEKKMAGENPVTPVKWKLSSIYGHIWIAPK